mmetsp:Transcript_55766/g.92255  ORF Transcript_55766/g.92255 Transcript_55766/m.92255 type:complete len:650 (-) Transcript_55766:198-2147(-)|eukprot:CAMPEP_0119309052 /NCGR_PEP_ID=MMETSP1333-20130426/13904_1 /TAXON_ID=418940 /ORGANISM="Scyphosphaera apsteinii, Strain RCC1455" /LENGTH=649 /DNA_ID=CAMNT_0007312959 /DNA_START=313 /DNA_END=2262 /DNA_ORIENTATION=+
MKWWNVTTARLEWIDAAIRKATVQNGAVDLCTHMARKELRLVASGQHSDFAAASATSLKMPTWGTPIACAAVADSQFCSASISKIHYGLCAPASCSSARLADLGRSLFGGHAEGRSEIAVRCDEDRPAAIGPGVVISFLALLILLILPHLALRYIGGASAAKATTKARKGDLDFTHGLRVLAIAWIVLCHAKMHDIYLFTYRISANASPYSDEILPSALNSIETYIGLDGVLTFIFLSCFLGARKLNERKPSLKVSIGSICLRAARLLPLLICCLLVFPGILYTIAQHYGNGLWYKLEEQQSKCSGGNWLWNLVFVPTWNLRGKFEDWCLPHTWYLAVDFAAFVLVTLPAWFARKAGWQVLIAMCMSLCAFHLIVTGANVCSSDLFIYTISADHAKGISGIWESALTQSAHTLTYFTLPACVGGTLCAFLLTDQRFVSASHPLWVVVPALLLALACFTFPLVWVTKNGVSTPWFDAIKQRDLALLVDARVRDELFWTNKLFLCLNPTFWTCSLIIMTLLMASPRRNSLLDSLHAVLSGNLFKAVSPYTFAIYLVHEPLYLVLQTSRTHQIEYDFWADKLRICGFFLICIPVAALMHHFVEQPWAAIIQRLMQREDQDRSSYSKGKVSELQGLTEEVQYDPDESHRKGAV